MLYPDLKTRSHRNTLPMKCGKVFPRLSWTPLKVEARSKHNDMEPPDYLEQQAQESIDDQWGQMDDDEKYNWAKENSMIHSDEEEETSEGELDALPTKFDPLNETTGTDYRAHSGSRENHVRRACRSIAGRAWSYE